MANNISVSVSADVGGLRGSMAVAQIAVQDLGKEVKALARTMQAGDLTKEAKLQYFQLSEALAAAEAKYASLNREYRRAQTATAAVNDNTGQLRAGMQNLGFQLQDVAVQFASGQRAGTIFAQQLPQISGAITQIAQAGGNASGALGRFASFMSGPWGVAVGVGTAVLAPFIAKLFETGNAADSAKEKVYGLQQAIADMRTKPAVAQGKLQETVSTAEGALNRARKMPRYEGGGSEEYRRNTYLEQARSKAIKKAEDDLEAARSVLAAGQLSAQNYDRLRDLGSSAGRLKAVNIKDDDGGSGSSARGAGQAAARAYRSGFDEELRALQQTTDKLEKTVFAPLAERTAEVFKFRDDAAAKELKERLSFIRQANALELAEMRRAEEQKRAIQERTFAPFAQSIARMLTLQRGFIGTVRDLWGSLVGVVEMAVARMVQSFLIGLLTQDIAQEKSHFKKVFMLAKQAAANAWNAVVGIPIVGPVLAPVAAAASFAGVMAFASAEDGWDVPGGGGAGVDGRGGRPAIIHPREMVLPAQIADSVRALPGGLAAAASMRGATASVADINDGGLSSPRIGGGGNRAARRGGAAGNGQTFNINVQAFDGHSVRRMFLDHGDKIAAAMSDATRNNWRPSSRRR